MQEACAKNIANPHVRARTSLYRTASFSKLLRSIPIVMMRIPASLCLAALFSLALRVSAASTAEPGGLVGDVGVGVTQTREAVRGVRTSVDPVPYLNAEVGRLFARIDTFGVKTLPVGYGHLELVGQRRNDGYRAEGLVRRRDSIPLGAGSLQVTPYGAFLATALHDFGSSHGDVVQALYAAELEFGRTTVYPEVGAEWLSRRYVSYYHAPRAAETVQTYRVSSGLNPFVGALVETRIAGPWYLNVFIRYTRFDRAISRSPLVDRRSQTDELVALAYRY